MFDMPERIIIDYATPMSHPAPSFLTARVLRRIGCAALASAVLAFSTACSKQEKFAPAAAPEKPVVALVMKSLANEFFQNMVEGAKQHQTQHAAPASITSPRSAPCSWADASSAVSGASRQKEIPSNNNQLAMLDEARDKSPPASPPSPNHL